MIVEYSAPWQELFPGCSTAAGSMKRGLSKEINEAIVIYRSKQAHGNKYTYDRLNYINGTTKMTVTCPVHGDFQVLPNNFLRGASGCQACAGNKKLTLEEFIAKARSVHGDKYSYDNAKYLGTDDKLLITCKQHGGFWQTPHHHTIRRQGCPLCAGLSSAITDYTPVPKDLSSTRSTTDAFIKKAEQIHGNRYSYESVDYIHSNKKVSIHCSEHGIFEQTPASHLAGRNCPECGKASISANMLRTTEEFISLARGKHGDRFDYSNVAYKGCYAKVSIVCKIHGKFYQEASSHLRGCGCPHCAKTVPDQVYLLHIYKNIYKIGISYDVARRIKELQKGFDSLNLGTVTIVAKSPVLPNAREIETILHEKYNINPELNEKIDGYTELRELTQSEVLEIKGFLEGLDNAGF